MKNLLTLIMVISMSSNLAADHHKNDKKLKKQNPNKLLDTKACKETKEGIGWLLGAADKVFDEIKEQGKNKDKAWNDEMWMKASFMSNLAANYSTVYDVWCKSEARNKMKKKIIKKKLSSDDKDIKVLIKKIIADKELFEEHEWISDGEEIEVIVLD